MDKSKMPNPFHAMPWLSKNADVPIPARLNTKPKSWPLENVLKNTLLLRCLCFCSSSAIRTMRSAKPGRTLSYSASISGVAEGQRGHCAVQASVQLGHLDLTLEPVAPAQAYPIPSFVQTSGRKIQRGLLALLFVNLVLRLRQCIFPVQPYPSPVASKGFGIVLLKNVHGILVTRPTHAAYASKEKVQSTRLLHLRIHYDWELR